MNFEIEDQSNDKQYFTIIPNYIANHSTANDQALYFQMKRYAGEKGKCFASEKLLLDKLKIGRKALKKSIEYLLNHKWITYLGKEKIETNSGRQERKIYSVNDIWQINNNYYKGVSERTPHSKKLSTGVSERTSRGVPENTQGVLSGPTKKNYNNKNKKEERKRTVDNSTYDDIKKKKKKLKDKFSFPVKEYNN